MDIFGEMDPYIVFEINGKKHRTTTKHSAGRFPNWKDDEQKFEL
jgi:Ca2+-dependent lipid-binding protein